MAIVLGLITAVGPFAIDMYLPALPSMGGSLNATQGAVQWSLTAFFIVIGACQLLYGPLSDMVGRKPPIYLGLALFTIGSIGSALAPGIEYLIGFRIVQAFGACAGMVIPRAIVRDLYTGHDATKLMSMLMLVVSVSPILAPLTGSFIIVAYGWRAVFATLTIAAAVAFVLAYTQLPETRPKALRRDSSWRSALAAYQVLFADAEFLGLVLVGGLGMATFFIYLSNASFVLINHFGLSPQVFSLCFALNAASFFGFSQFTSLLGRRFGLTVLTRIAATGFATAMGLLALITATGFENLAVMMAMLFVGYGFLGLLLPTTGVLALDRHGSIAGTASALMGALQMVLGSGIMGLCGALSDGTPRPMLIGIGVTAALAFCLTWALMWATRGRRGRVGSDLPQSTR
jgi:DHA1 family bicyclomycin/chloramphenicol resistance-like MFS transporter